MISSIVSRLVILVFGTLYPAYASYKAVRTKNVKEYVKWMMYWIVFALFTCAETFTDVFLSFWFPFYYEIKIILVLWLLSPATKGSSILYRKFVHPMLSRREQEIDEYIAKAKEQGYHTVLHLGTKGVNYATTVLMQTAIKGGGGLVNQLRRSYSLSDLSSDKESDMNRNSKALKNVPDEDDMEEETDGLDPRMLRPRGYSPRRSASGSGRVEMYFPEVDVDVRQRGSSRPREPSIPLSHIRSSEDVSSGYSSAEPLYAGHHATKSEGLAASREPLVRTASVGSTRSMRTKSSRGGVVAKRGPAAEDSELLDPQGDEADYHYQEEYFYDVSSSLSSYVSTSIPFPATVTANRSAALLCGLPENSYPSAQNEVDITPYDISDVTSVQEQYIDASDVKQDSPDDEDVPLYDAESDESKISSNELLLPETSVSSVKEDIVSTSSHEISLSKDVTVQNLNMAADGIIQHTVVPSTELVLSNEPLTSHLNTSNKNLVSDTFIVHTENNNVAETLTENKNGISVQKECSVINVKDIHSEQTVTQHIGAEPKITIHDKTDISNSLEATQKLEKIASDSVKYVEPSNLAQPTHTTPEVMETLDTTVSSNFISEPLGNDELSASDIREVNSVADETVSETLAAMATYPLTLTSAESLSPDNTMDLSSESQDSKYDAGVDQSNNYAGITFDLNSRHVVIDKPITDTLQPLEVEHRTPKVDESFETSAGGEGLGQTEGSDVQPLQVNSSCAYESVESLSPLELPIRSSSQSSLRKEGRAGRYHKGPAPTPPIKDSESDNENWTDVQEPEILSDIIKASASPKEVGEFVHSPQALETEDSEAAVTARLVLKPGVVRSLGPDFGTKAEVFVSRTPQVKSKRSKSKKKQGDSALSRLFVLPKNQFGGLSSFFSFWPGKQEVPTSASTENGAPESSNLYGLSALESSSSSAFVPVHEKTSSGSLKHSDSRSDVNVKEMSHSPGQRRRAPLAGWE